MKVPQKIALLFAFLLVGLASPIRAESLFVFHENESQASVYDADTLELIASPSVGRNAKTALRIDEKTILVAASRRLVFLGSNFEVTSAIDLIGPLAQSANPVAVSGPQNLVLVTADGNLLVIDPNGPSLLKTTSPGFPVGSIAVLDSEQRALISAAGSSQARYFDLTMLDWQGEEFQLPSNFGAISSPGGGSATFAYGDQSVYDLSHIQPAGGAVSVRPNTPAKLATLGTEEFLLLRGGELMRGSLDKPGAATNIFSAAKDFAVRADGTAIFVASEGNHVLRLNEAGEPAGRIELPSQPSALALVGEPKRQALGVLAQVFGNNELVLPGAEFTLGVRALDANGVPQVGLAVFVANLFPPGQTTFCPPVITDTTGLAVLNCIAGESTTAFNIQLTIRDALGRSAPGFTISVVPTGLTDGLNKISGDQAVIPRNTAFNLVVQAVENGSPQAALPLTIARIPNDVPLVCPLQAVTLSDGTATISCGVGNVAVPTVVQITVADNVGRFANFTVTVVPQDNVSDGLNKVSGDNQEVARNSTFPMPLVVSYLVGGIPQQGAKLTVNTNINSLVFCPTFVLTDENGLGTIFCSAGPAGSDIFVKIFVTDPEGQTLPEPFDAKIVPNGPNFAADLRLLSDDELEGTVGDTLVNAMKVATVDGDGDRVAGVTVFFSSTENVVFRPSVGVTGGSGTVEATLTLGCPSRRGTVSAGLLAGESLITIPLRINAGPADQMVIDQGDGQRGIAGERLDDVALAVKITDRCGTRLHAVPVAWTVEPPDAATLESTVNATDGQGRASTLVRLGTRPGPFQIIATSGEMRQAFNLTVTAEPAKLSAIGGNEQSVPIGTEANESLVVEVQAADGQTIEGVGIAFVVDQGDGSVTIPFSRTNSQGRASTRFLAGTTAGSVRVLAIVANSQTLSQKSANVNQVSTILAEFNLRVTGRAPLVSSVNFVNGASFQPGWVPGSTGTVFGVNLTEGLDGAVVAGPAPFPTDLLGVSLSVNGIPAPILGVANVNGQEQINIQVPFEIPAPSSATVILENNGTAVTVPGVGIERAQAGIFEAVLDGRSQAAALHTDFSLVTKANPARRGETILLFLTGLGPTRTPVATNEAGPVPARQTVFDVAVGIDHAGMANSGAFYAPGLVSVYQINFIVAADVQSGDRTLNVVAQGVSSTETVIPVE